MSDNSAFGTVHLPKAIGFHLSHWQIFGAAAAAIFLVGWIFVVAIPRPQSSPKQLASIAGFCRFFYASFLKLHTGDGAGTGQQAALESFYKLQVQFLFRWNDWS